MQLKSNLANAAGAVSGGAMPLVGWTGWFPLKPLDFTYRCARGCGKMCGGAALLVHRIRCARRVRKNGRMGKSAGLLPGIAPPALWRVHATESRQMQTVLPSGALLRAAVCRRTKSSALRECSENTRLRRTQAARVFGRSRTCPGGQPLILTRRYPLADVENPSKQLGAFFTFFAGCLWRTRIGWGIPHHTLGLPRYINFLW